MGVGWVGVGMGIQHQMFKKVHFVTEINALRPKRFL